MRGKLATSDNDPQHPLDAATIDHVARLARLELGDDEKRRLQAELGQILAHFADLEQLATDQIAPTAMVVRTELPLREDVAGPSLPRDEVLANAPESRAGFFAVPAVLDQ
jgi:aspartyl-tRNA(Asn)/glutamyl-tRNA(Gln) amidotransferase subunit C